MKKIVVKQPKPVGPIADGKISANPHHDPSLWIWMENKTQWINMNKYNLIDFSLLKKWFANCNLDKFKWFLCKLFGGLMNKTYPLFA